MTNREIKTEIQKILEEVPEEVLHDLLEYLREAQKLTRDQAVLSSHLRKILSEDKELLEKLAQ
ncbi:MAG: hypothetical protein GX168_10205 [Bacteroidales bacterium]|jgi:hypothetical protein|nr:hypothetical protein [Bacteroidales bacterium]